MTADLVAVWAKIPTPRGVQEAVLASAYFPGEEETAPTAEIKAFVEHCQQSGKPWILCCDANSHNTVWGSTDTNKRGEYLLEFISSYNINIINRGNEPTFRNALRGRSWI